MRGQGCSARKSDDRLACYSKYTPTIILLTRELRENIFLRALLNRIYKSATVRALVY